MGASLHDCLNDLFDRTRQNYGDNGGDDMLGLAMSSEKVQAIFARHIDTLQAVRSRHCFRRVKCPALPLLSFIPLATPLHHLCCIYYYRVA